MGGYCMPCKANQWLSWLELLQDWDSIICPCLATRSIPSQRLQVKRCRNSCANCEVSYDCVVIDSAPLLRATEARLLASMVDSVLFAVKWGATPRETAQNALGLLRRSAFKADDLQGRIAAVITQVDLKKHARYRYGDFSENLLQVKPQLA